MIKTFIVEGNVAGTGFLKEKANSLELLCKNVDKKCEILESEKYEILKVDFLNKITGSEGKTFSEFKAVIVTKKDKE